MESRFFVLDEEMEAFRKFVNGIELDKEGDGLENSLEALAFAVDIAELRDM